MHGEASYRERYQAEVESLQRELPESARWVDTHCHLESILNRTWRGGKSEKVRSSETRVGLPALMRTWPQGLEGCICNSVFRLTSDPRGRTAGSEWRWLDENLEHFDAAAPQLPRLWFTIGIHPHDAASWDRAAEERLRELCMHPACVGIGECGLDAFKHRPRKLASQANTFRAQLRVATEVGKPIVLHIREAEDMCLEILDSCVPAEHPVHVHCFSGSLAQAEALMRSRPNLRLGFTGSITFREGGRGARLAELVRALPLDRLLLETDGPYMCPAPFRGQTAHPGHVHLVARRLAELHRVSLPEVLRATRESCRVVYGI